LPLVQRSALAGLRHEAGGSARGRQVRRALRGKDTPARKIGGPGGAYLLLLSLPGEASITVGKLGRLHFRAGNYVYVGSAMAGLEARVARHFRRERKVQWHIDRLLARARIAGAVLFPSSMREECALAQAVQGYPGTVAVGRFGSTDCGCPAHLFFLGKRPFGPLLLLLDRTRVPEERGPVRGGR
jgi:Uri superfamily endonuclease